MKKCKEIAEGVSEESTETIIALLITGQDLLPTYEHTKQIAEKLRASQVLLAIAPVSVKDSYGHTAEWFDTEDEKGYFRILEQYNMAIQLEKQFLINEILVRAIQKDKLNIHLLMSFLEKNSWYGKNIKKSHPSGTVVYNWLNMIAPSLNDYFTQLKAHILEPSYSPNFILAMDSLTVKIEGLIRDICDFSGVTTFYQMKDKQGRPIVREKDINWLLREGPVTRLFSQDDLLFFKYVLVEKAGLNLRHKIAHCLIDYAEYNMTFMHLLLLLLLRLGKYDFVTPDKAVEEKVEDLQ
jgi:phosphoribosyl-ATP pyrophosphohydrolase